jgi:hypothetical protein
MLVQIHLGQSRTGCALALQALAVALAGYAEFSRAGVLTTDTRPDWHPPEVMEEHRIRAADSQDRRVGLAGWMVVVLVWIAATGLAA